MAAAGQPPPANSANWQSETQSNCSDLSLIRMVDATKLRYSRCLPWVTRGRDRQGGAVSEQGYPPRQPDHPSRGGRTRSPQDSRSSGWQALGAFEPPADYESDAPPWAIPGGIEPMRPTRRLTRTVAHE